MKKADFFHNIGGVNLTDSPFAVHDNQAMGGYNYDLLRTGAISKRRGHSIINNPANTNLYTLGMDIHNPSIGDKALLRAADLTLQTLNTTTGVGSTISEDTQVSNTSFFAPGSTQPVVFSNFNTPNANETWFAGGGATTVDGYITYQTNGVYQWTVVGQFVLNNIITFTINGTNYSVNFDTDQATTLRNIANKMNTNASVGSAFSNGVDYITLTSKEGAALSIINNTVTGGFSQPTVSVTTIVTPSGSGVTLQHVTKNGVPAPTGSFTVLESGTGAGGTFLSIGYYTYAVIKRKASTKASSNASLDVLAHVTDVTQVVNLFLPVETDTTKYDEYAIYRSAVTTSATLQESFTTGDLIAVIPITQSLYVDTGSFLATSQNVPRAGNTVLDNSTLPDKTYNFVTTFKRRLIVAQGSTFYLSDLDKPESWPVNNFIDIPTGGPITGLSVIGYNAYFSGNTDEFLVIFKERELWMLSGDGPDTWVLKFVDAVGCMHQRLAVHANGYIAWVSDRGIYLWAGSGKPTYTSRLIESLFSIDGDIKKNRLQLGWGVFYRKQNQIIWVLSHRTLGDQSFAIKLDVRLTLPVASEELDQKVIDGVFSQDSNQPLYAGVPFVPFDDPEERLFSGDISGNIYKMYFTAGDSNGTINFSYLTKQFDMQTPAVSKRYYKVIAYVDILGSWDLNLDYYTEYRAYPLEKSSLPLTMLPKNTVLPALWDVAIWDVAFWDAYKAQIRPITFNLGALQGNNEGDALQLNFYNNNNNEPVILHGFSVLYDEITVRK